MSKNQMVLNVVAIYCLFSGFFVPFVFDIDFSKYSVLHLLFFLTFSLLIGYFFKKITLIDKASLKQEELFKQDFKWGGFYYFSLFYDFVIMPVSIGVFFVGAFLIL